MSIRVRINYLQGLNKTCEEVIAFICSQVPITIRDIHYSKEFLIIHLDEPDTEKLLAPDTHDKLLQHHLRVLTPQGFTSGKTVFVTKLTEYFTNHDPNTILENINHSNNNITALSVYIIKGKQSNSFYKTLKIVMASTINADHVTKNGLKLFNVCINSNNIHKEDPINIIQCFKCLKFDHYTNTCKAAANTCSICSGSHYFKQCTNKSRVSCANCNGPHIAVASVCPERKKYIQHLLVKQKSQKVAPQSKPEDNIPPVHNPLNFPPPPISNSQHNHLNPLPVINNIYDDTNGHLLVMIEYAKMRTMGDHEAFISLMNQYFIHNNKPPLNLPRFNDNNTNNSEANTPPPVNISELRDAATSPHTEILAPIPFSQVVQSHTSITNKQSNTVVDVSTSPNWPEDMVRDQLPFSLNSQPPPNLSNNPTPNITEGQSLDLQPNNETLTEESLNLQLSPSKENIDSQETNISPFHTPLSSSVSILTSKLSRNINVNFSKSEEGRPSSNSIISINSGSTISVVSDDKSQASTDSDRSFSGSDTEADVEIDEKKGNTTKQNHRSPYDFRRK